MNFIIKALNTLIFEFGFGSITEFGNSTFGYATKKSSIFGSSFFGIIAVYFENYIGLSPIVYLAFILLLILEFFTGISASIKEGSKIQSKRFGRVILKLMTYTILIGVINIFRTRLASPNLLSYEVNVYSIIFYVSLNLIFIQLILSVFENLSRLGYEETSKVYGVISKILRRYVKLVSPEESDVNQNKKD
tara:strand:- start:12625 stop:13197 length:573 start_codon:yes stop_codon:yes gene_type:complete